MFTISTSPLSTNAKPYIIAEVSANHCGNIDRAKATIKAAHLAGASAVKIQSYTPDTMTIDSDKIDFHITDGLWKGYNLYQLYEEAHTPFEWHEELFNFARDEGITLFSTPFDETAVDLLARLDAPAFKIASFELTDLPLICYAAEQGKPMLVSTGMGTIAEVAEAVSTIKKTGNNQILLFHCISSYPAPTEQSNLSNINFLQREFNVAVGLSDHTISNLASSLAISLGAVAIEKHFKLDDEETGPDSSFSLNPEQFKSLVDDCNKAWLAMGKGHFDRAEVEGKNKNFRRSLYFVRDLKPGDVITADDIKRIRPGYGLEPKYFDKVVGRILKEAVTIGDRVTWDCFQ